jgi:uncharacterized membrane protein YGL010W
MATAWDFLQKCTTLLQAQHAADLRIYRGAHTDRYNRAMHWILIPVETTSFLLLTCTLLRSLHIPHSDIVVASIGWTLGLVAVSITSHRLVGLACLIGHVGAAAWVNQTVRRFSSRKTLWVLGIVAWTLAWALQVGLGHWIWEGNNPNVANMSQVSWLALTQSVLIAWSS